MLAVRGAWRGAHRHLRRLLQRNRSRTASTIAKAKLVITADGGFRRGKVVELKANVDQSRREHADVQQVLVVKRCGNPVQMKEAATCGEGSLEGAEYPQGEGVRFRASAFILYTSGSTENRRACCTRAPVTCSREAHFTLHFRSQGADRYFCSADIGWITGHSYVVYGLMANGATIFIYEGAPNQPEPDRFWQMSTDGLTILHAPTAIARSALGAK